MIAIGEGSFVLTSPSLRDRELQSYAKALFIEFDNAASDRLPLDDFGLHLEVEQGSIRGKSAILATLGAIYLGVGHFGDFVQGVREIGSLAKSAVDEVNKLAPQRLWGAPKSLQSKRSNAGKLGDLNRLFEAVARGELQPDEATQRAMTLFSDDAEIPDGFADDLERAVRGITLDPHQLDLLPELPEIEPLVPPAPRPRRKELRDQPIADLRHRLRIELHRAHKRGRTVVKVITL